MPISGFNCLSQHLKFCKLSKENEEKYPFTNDWGSLSLSLRDGMKFHENAYARASRYTFYTDEEHNIVNILDSFRMEMSIYTNTQISLITAEQVTSV